MTTNQPTTPLELQQHAELLELESQIRSLNTKISAAVDHAADLQDEIRTMRARQREEQEAREQLAGESSLRRMSTYFSGRRPSATGPRTDSRSPSKGLPFREEDEDLITQLQRERLKRQDIEAKYKALQDESEDLSQSLFEEANNMVATEKRSLQALTFKFNTLQEREMDRRKRVDEMQRAVATMARARGILDQGVT